MRGDDFREQLLSAKKAHQLALRENAHFRTRLRIAESECRRREAEIERLLKAQANDGTAEGQSAKARLEITCLRRKLLLYERMVHEKSAENEKLMSDKGVAQVAETRKTMNRLESECQRLRSHLAQSVPESEFLREKEQYTAIINKLVEENMHLRSVIGEFEERRKETERTIAQLGGSDALVRQFRQTAISSRRQANFYRKALGNLIRRKGHENREIVSVGEESGKDGEERQREGTRDRRKSESDSSKQSEKGMGNSCKGRETETDERKLETESDRKEMPSEKEEKNVEKDSDKEEKDGQKRAADRNSLACVSSRSSSTPPALSPRGAFLPPTRVSSTASSSRKEQRDEEEEEEDEDQAEEEEKEIEESQLNALFRVLHSHILRQQMLKVRRERDDCPNFVGMGNFY